MTKSKLNLLFPLLCLFLCLLFPTACTVGVRRGLSVSLEAALPALFPSLVLSCLLTKEVKGGGEKSFLIPFFLGLFCGFPVGAASVASLVKNGHLSKKDGEKLLLFCNNAGPAFLIAYCGEVILHDRKKGLLLFLLQSLTATVFFLFFFGKRIFCTSPSVKKEDAFSAPFWKNVPLALRESTNSFLYILSCIIFFSFFSELFRELFSLNKTGFALLSIFTELCGGLDHLRSLSGSLAFPLCALGCGWGGCSVHLQTIGLLEESGLSAKNHLLGKGVFALILFLSALFFQKHL